MLGMLCACHKPGTDAANSSAAPFEPIAVTAAGKARQRKLCAQRYAGTDAKAYRECLGRIPFDGDWGIPPTSAPE
ncbi:MAG: hypothetical protein KGL54_00765 [Sphingomonadales bacterium]|nr:hypothetical protein [Sphingomonadales bacterium]